MFRIFAGATRLGRRKKQLAGGTYDCVVIGGGLRLPPERLLMSEKVINSIHKAAPGSAIDFNTHPEDTADAEIAGCSRRLALSQARRITLEMVAF